MSIETHAGNDDATRRLDESAPEPVTTVTIAPAPTEPTGPVFVDGSGRRARTVRGVGALAGIALIAYFVVVGVNLSTGAEVPFTPWPAGKSATDGDQRGPDGKPRTRDQSPRPVGPGTGSANGGTQNQVPGNGVPSNGGLPSNGVPAPGNPSAAPQPPATANPQVPPTTAPAPTPPSTATPVPSPTPTRPGNSQASPPAHGKKKKEQSG
ncbi:hypothetical protein [Actinomadura rudentiformis]|uniref:Uncharacterized protein n=1 Tax=Actinomadura rudentiformis TaxID=359158 RepID=A0A6H9YLW2_9ACTN|nr:hypothetical protein [Actinomadura rudentiformis]KAB2341344.1 hypothetical protein F8566_42285 [Actinomadura rudentiformis]